MNEPGEPNMGKPSVRFDEGRERVGHWPCASQSDLPAYSTKSNVAPVKLVGTRVKVPPVELGCSRRNTTSTASPRGGVGS